MLKNVIVFSAGIIVGAGVMWFGPHALAHTAKEGASSAISFAERKKYESCRKDFLHDSQCYENEPIPICDRKIVRKCGSEPAKGTE